MTGTDVFDLYRRTLAIVFGTYAVIRLINAVWRWQLATQRAGRSEAMLRRYVLVSLLRVRLRRFWFDVVQIGVLTAMLTYLLWLHVR